MPARGEEIAFAGRVRVTLDARMAGLAARRVPLRIDEQRVVPGASLALNEDVLLSADVPLLRRALTSETGVRDRLVLGDAEARVSYLASRSSSRRLTFFGGMKAPTAPLERDDAGRLVPTDLQPGCGSLVPTVGVTYTIVRGMWSTWTSASLLLPFSVRSGPHAGDSLRASVSAQLQPWRAFAVRLSGTGRFDSTGAIDGRVDTASGGASVFVVPELVASPVPDLVLTAGAAIPAVQETRGHSVTAPIALAGVGWDF